MPPLAENPTAIPLAPANDRGARESAHTERPTAPLRVLHVLDRFDTGGTEHGVLKLVTGLSEQKFESRVCVMRGTHSKLAESAKVKERVLYAGCPEKGRQLGFSKLIRVFHLWRPHIVHGRNWGAIEAVAAARWARVPVAIHSEHGYELNMLGGLPLRNRLFRRGMYALADAVFSVSRELSAYHARQAGCSPEKVGTIYNGVDTDRFKPRPLESRRIREELGIPEGRFVIGAAGRLVSIKDYPTLLRAAQQLLHAGNDVSVLIVGDGPERVALEREAAPLGERIKFLGKRDDLPVLFNAMNVFVQTSICEGMSNTILEAMASGLPVVATGVGGNPELVTEEQTGLLFSPGDVPTLAANLARLVGNLSLSRRLGTAARELTLLKFGLERMLASYESLYLTLAARRGLSVER
jgi:sugar transferase (PEP-CTERM/EpsH1 system associated)